MDRETIRTALASLVAGTNLVSGWENRVKSQLGEVPDEIQGIVTLASRLSTGASEGKTGGQNQLKNIFGELSLSDPPPPKSGEMYLPLKPLALTKEALFPTSASPSETRAAEIRSELAKSMEGEYAEDESYLEKLLSALHRLTCSVPSAEDANVSLYDHQRMTAALAVCILDRGKETAASILSALEQKNKDAGPLEEPLALLVGGDISGIQDFIYTITAKGAAKSLRGRSFYLQLLTEAILRFVLRKLEIAYSNVIYSGGGHFFLLAPVSKAGDLAGYQKEITQVLLEHHGTSLYLALGYAEIPAGGFLDGKFPQYWGTMHRDMAHRKQRRYSELDANLFEKVFAVAKYGGNPANTCSVCGEDHRPTQPLLDDDGNQLGRICTLCQSFVDLFGKTLPKNHFLALGFGEPKSAKYESASDVLEAFGMNFQFLESSREKVALRADQIVLWALDDPENGGWPGNEGAPRWLRYTANQVTPLSFDQLQAKVEGGFERLGVLRMDVDNLGDLFKKGFEDKASLTRLASLSFRTSLFFEGWLKKLCEEGKYKGLIYTVYAGGDDVFLIGPWDLIPGLAQEIVHDFAEYTGNPDVHVSAGMAFIDGKYPVYQAADDAKDAIDEAKEMDGKDAFTFLGKSWKWKVFGEIADKQGQLSRLVRPQGDGNKPAPQALLQVLQQLAIDAEQHKKVKGRHIWGRWIWMGMYQLMRMQERQGDIAGDLKSISDGLQANGYQDIDQWGVAARWGQLAIRNKK